jgi:transposase
MAFGFVPVDRGQQFLMPPSLADWLPADHEVWFVLELVEGLDLSEMEAAYRLGAQGRAPLSPSMLLALLVYAYSRGVESSRAIERACREDVAFRVICANDAPDHTSIARFRQRHEAAIKGVFAQILGLCRRAGLVRLGVVAVDGTRMAANASLGANREVDRLREIAAEIVDRAGVVDDAEDEQFGDRRGDELPEDLADPQRRRKRIRQLLAELDAEDGEPRARVNVTDQDSRAMASTQGFVQGYNAQALVDDCQVIVAAEVTNDHRDSDQLSRILDLVGEMLAAAEVDGGIGMLLADAGYFSTDNLAAVAAREIDALIATTKRSRQPDEAGEDLDGAWQAEQDRLDAERAAEQRRRAAIFERIMRDGTSVGDVLDELGMSRAAAYKAFKAWKAEQRPDAVPVPRRRATMTKPTRAASARAAMNAKLADPANRKLYKQRRPMVEGTFAQIKHNRGSRRFRRRGLAAVNSEWQLSATIHNIGRLRTALSNLFSLLAGQPATA